MRSYIIVQAVEPDPDELVSAAPTKARRRRPRLNQPWRGLIAVFEVIIAAALVLGALWVWHHGSAVIVLPKTADHPELVSTVYFGNWLAGAIGLGTAAGLLVLNAIRQVLLAVRTSRT